MIAGVKRDGAQKKMMVDGLRQQRDSVGVIRGMKIPNSVAPALVLIRCRRGRCWIR